MIEKIGVWIKEAESAVVLTGAGISTDSGIPDFRSPNGFWQTNRTIYFDEFKRSPEARFEHWRQKSELHSIFSSAHPNVAHKIIAAWEASGVVRGVITQNVDGLHQDAGSNAVIELHGTSRKIQCLDCRNTFDADPLVRKFREENSVPPCPTCETGRLKHATISFGQPLDTKTLFEAEDWCKNADAIIAVGSSLSVFPASGLPRLKKGKLIIINRDETALDSFADLVIKGEIGDAISAVNGMLE
jgi:NAD-dependent deacetylase